MSFPLASITVYNSVVFGFFSNTQRLISKYRYGDGRHPCSMLDLTVASMLTGLVSVGLGAPVDLVKIRLQMQTQMVLAENLHLAGSVSNGTNIPLRSVSIPSHRLYRGPIHCISSILQTEGLQGLYRGAGAMILRDVPGYTLYFIPYTIFCNLLKPDATSSPHPCSIWLAGGLAGSISWVTATPADVVKSRMQADAQLQRKYRGIVHCIVHSYRTDGIQVFFPRSVGERHPRFPHERHHVPDLRAVAAVLQEPVGRFRLAEHTNMWSHSWRQFEPPLT
ncbi:hypothetical protein INR49_010758 [Caranx melampygus]|nr:hypothetical protein INR49_010758 [Caranx melampygus]